mmetsp:Transcript_14809/g.16397  ORF Transcript_14809/g.16397 Transcript_14809/m.16397 type:complete len:170 (+) Transcript_14809:277-786(+)
MGTRGLFGYYHKGNFYVVYNHWDSYPSGLGEAILDEVLSIIKPTQLQSWIERIDSIKVIDPNTKPTPEDVKKTVGSHDLSVSDQSLDDWYCLLRGCQGSLSAVLCSGYLLNHTQQSGEPDWEEYSYILNLDSNSFDYYKYDTLAYSEKFELLDGKFFERMMEKRPEQDE